MMYHTDCWSTMLWSATLCTNNRWAGADRHPHGQQGPLEVLGQVHGGAGRAGEGAPPHRALRGEQGGGGGAAQCLAFNELGAHSFVPTLRALNFSPSPGVPPQARERLPLCVCVSHFCTSASCHATLRRVPDAPAKTQGFCHATLHAPDPPPPPLLFKLPRLLSSRTPPSTSSSSGGC